MKPWVQELLWVRKDVNGVIVRIEKDLPVGADFIPTVNTAEKEKSAAGQGN